MKRFFQYLFFLLLISAQTFAQSIDEFQPPITRTSAPERPLNAFSLYNNTTKVGLAEMQPIIPAFNGRGMLLASWNPQPVPSSSSTVVIVHGGHGLVPTNFSTGLWMFGLKVNVLILDSYWSRGAEENWLVWTRFGANTRMLDVVAAGRWLRDVQHTNPKTTFLFGDSQGGWTVLRSFTDEPFVRDKVESLYKAGISLYPNCIANGSDLKPKLGPYFASVIVFTGGKDTATPISECSRTIFSRAITWVHYDDQTHAWDSSTHGAHTAPVDGHCFKALNKYNHFEVCRSDKTTFDMREKIEAFIKANS